MTELTLKQQQILDFIKDKIKSSDMPPTRAEIATFFGFKSNNAAEEHLRAIARKGHIKVFAGTARGIHVVGYKKSSLEDELIKLSRIMDNEFGPIVGHFVRQYVAKLN